MRFIFSPPADGAAGLLDLPWEDPLESWQDERLVEVPTAGIHRHVVRFVETPEGTFVLKELPDELVRREYRVLRELADVSIPAVEVVGACLDRVGQDSILVTRFLSYSATYRRLLSTMHAGPQLDALIGGMVELLVRLHLAGYLWGDCSLSNTLFKLDAGDLEAYLVDAETMEHHPALTAGQRSLDLDFAHERIGGELMDLEAGGLLAEDIDPVDTADSVRERYHALWNEVNREDVVAKDEQRYLIGERMRRIEELGFDVDEVELLPAEDGSMVRVRTRVADPGRWRRLLLRRTGLDVQDQQARRLLADIASFRAWLEQESGQPVSEAAAASRWVLDCYNPIVSAIPAELRGKRDEAEVFHEVLEQRWLLSERAGHDVSTSEAARHYFQVVLPDLPTASLPVIPEHD
ncbi:DUF4032 domain-containing protein [Nocardioides jiangxiensis]|uniref:DUF4032 domain-containing protein n=1 Tax=Nocardioides jiangxiensis TaxID=3064524 RepID=A0ABT9B240_9ACTN|nr:DUF4032 domain-containing protein [Nocardioides sp. WY-20]MDO7868379.1 DUF4032 domain-containing protein [Nocardioides sp. WY-20]